MYINKLSLRSALFWLVFCLGVTLIPKWPVQAVTFEPPAGDAPKQSSGGASRDGGQCFSQAKTNAAVTPLTPDTHYGLTVAERPTFFVYLPETGAKEMFFSVQDQDGKQAYQTTLPLPDKPGVIGVKLPASAPALEVGKNYKWSLVMVCGGELEPDSPGVEGWVRRVAPTPTLKSQKQLEVSLESASELAKAGIWYDALSALAQLRQAQPENLALSAHWKELLESVKLDAIATEPLIK
jgi:hypothetical protein